MAQPIVKPRLNLVPTVLSYWEPGLSRTTELTLYRVRLQINRP